jgi:phosphoenolpyruvate carboxykinase (ATP)
VRPAGHPEQHHHADRDAFGVMPPIAKLTPEQAMYHFLSGYTAKVAGTEKGVTEPKPPSRPALAHPSCRATRRVYGDLLRKLIAEHGVDCWLVNTGWTGGAYGDRPAHADQGDR